MSDLLTGIAEIDQDPVMRLLLQGKATTVAEAQEMALEANLSEIIRVIESSISDDEFLKHPLVELLLMRGSRPWEDALR